MSMIYLGASIGVKCAVIVGGMDMVTQALMLAKKPHIIIATPGRLVDHLQNTKGFSLKSLRFLVNREILLYYTFLQSFYNMKIHLRLWTKLIEY